jgi:hypothetical protein
MFVARGKMQNKWSRTLLERVKCGVCFLKHKLKDCCVMKVVMRIQNLTHMAIEMSCSSEYNMKSHRH